MVQFTITYTNKFWRELKRIDRNDQKRILRRIELLAGNPYIGDRLVNSPFWKLRVGKYRVIYDIRGNILEVLILTVGKRDIVYKAL